jgi:hypothetical protein
LMSGRQIMHALVMQKEGTMFEVATWCCVWCLVVGTAALWHVLILSLLLGF